jgi:hypothetical protein
VARAQGPPSLEELSNSGSNGSCSEYGTYGAGTSVVTLQPNDDGWAMAFASFTQPSGTAAAELYPFGMWFQ